MYKPRLALLPLLLGLTSAFFGCQERVISSESESASGQIAFRMSAVELVAMQGMVDSVRIDAIRPGYATKTVAAALSGVTQLSDLAAGPWTIQVALYDSIQAIRWFGQVQVEVVPGRSVDALIHLARASGSVRVRIVLDSATTRSDTLVVQEIAYVDSATWSPLAAWRTQDGIYLRELTTCQTSTVRYSRLWLPSWAPAPHDLLSFVAIPAPFVVDSSTLVLQSLDNPNGLCGPQGDTVLHFVAWTRPGDVTLVTSMGRQMLADPRVVPTPEVRVIYPTVGGPVDYKAIHKAWRTDSGFFIQAIGACEVFLVRQIPDSGTLLQFGTDPNVAVDCMPGYSPIATLFVPWTACGNVTLVDANGRGSVYGGKRCLTQVRDSAFSLYLVKRFDGISTEKLTLDANGKATRSIQSNVDTVVVTYQAQLSLSDLAVVRGVLESEAIRNARFLTASVYLPYPDCHTEPMINGEAVIAFPAPTDSRRVTYANGAISELTWNSTSRCAQAPAGWGLLDPVDSLVRGLFVNRI